MPARLETLYILHLPNNFIGYKGLLHAPPIVIVMSLLASIGGILFGYDQGVISGVLVMNNFVWLPEPLSPSLP